MILGILLFGSFWFWVYIVAISIFLMAACEYSKPFLAASSLFGAALTLKFFGDVNVFRIIADHPLNTVYLALGYLVAGAIWSLAKWWFFVREARDRFEQKKAEWIADRIKFANVPETKEQIESALKRHVSVSSYYPKASKEKSRIMTWMCYWPWSLVWTIINDPVKKAFTAIFNRMKATFDKIAKKAFEGSGIEDQDV